MVLCPKLGYEFLELQQQWFLQQQQCIQRFNCAPGHEIRVNKVTALLKMDELVIEKAYKKARKHNRRSKDMVFFEHERYARIAGLANAMNAKSYTPCSNYSFVHRRGSKPREVFAAEPELKIIMSYLLERLGANIEARLSPYAYNNRIGMGTQAAVNKVAENIYLCSQGYTKPCWIIKYDYKGYFPNMLRDIAYKQFKSIIDNDYKGSDKDDLYYALAVSCFCEPSRSFRRMAMWEWNDIPSYKSVYSRRPGLGGMIGYQFWQAAATLYPSEIDKFVVENVTPFYVRYVDDSVLITDNKEAVLAMIPAIRKMCEAIGINLHPDKFYCQPYQHGLEFLGYHILPHRIHINRRVVGRARSAAKSTTRGKNNYRDSVNSYLGMIKGTSDLKAARQILDSVSGKKYKKDYNEYKIMVL